MDFRTRQKDTELRVSGTRMEELSREALKKSHQIRRKDKTINEDNKYNEINRMISRMK